LRPKDMTHSAHHLGARPLFLVLLFAAAHALAGCTPDGEGNRSADTGTASTDDAQTTSGSDADNDAPSDTTSSGCNITTARAILTAPLDPASPAAATNTPLAFSVSLADGTLQALSLPAGASGLRDLVVSPDRTKIAWSSQAALDGAGGPDVSAWNLWIANADGSNPTALTQATVADLVAIKPTFSPDNKTLYFVSNAKLDAKFTGIVGAHNVWSIPAAGGTATALTLSTVAGHDVATEGTPIAVSSDGQRVVFASKGDLDGAFNRKAQASFNIFAMLSDGTELEALTRNELVGLDSVNIQIPPAGPAADIIFFQSSTSLAGAWNALPVGPNLWRMNIDGSRREALTNSGQLPTTNPRVSPDGRFLAYIAYADLDTDDTNGTFAGRNVWLYDIAADAHRPITTQGAPYIQEILYEISASQAAFSPDGAHVLFTSNGHRDGTPHVYLLPADAPPEDPLVLEYQAHCEHPDHQGDKTCEENWSPSLSASPPSPLSSQAGEGEETKPRNKKPSP
jgi:Tol biopolymer transport system component